MAIKKRTSLRTKLDKKQSKSVAPSASTSSSSLNLSDKTQSNKQKFLDKLAEKRARQKVPGYGAPVGSNSISSTYQDFKGIRTSNTTQLGITLFDPDQKGISKSALRRRRRKVRDSLKPKLNDLFDVLPPSHTVPSQNATTSHSYVASGDIAIDSTENTEVDARKKLDHKPNPHSSQRGAKRVETAEIKRFGMILKDEGFRVSPFDALKQAILNNSEKY